MTHFFHIRFCPDRFHFLNNIFISNNCTLHSIVNKHFGSTGKNVGDRWPRGTCRGVISITGNMPSSKQSVRCGQCGGSRGPLLEASGECERRYPCRSYRGRFSRTSVRCAVKRESCTSSSVPWPAWISKRKFQTIYGNVSNRIELKINRTKIGIVSWMQQRISL